MVGLGYIAQVAVLPAFAHATAQLRAGGARLRRPRRSSASSAGSTASSAPYSYEQFDECLASGSVDAVYIALPNHLHREYADARGAGRRARAVREADGRHRGGLRGDDPRRGARRREADDRLPAALRGRRTWRRSRSARSRTTRRAARLRLASSRCRWRQGNIRLQPRDRRGPLYDIGIYCINAARYLFRDEPTRSSPAPPATGRPRFREVEEMTSARSCASRTSGWPRSPAASARPTSSDYQRGRHQGRRCAWTRPTSIAGELEQQVTVRRQDAQARSSRSATSSRPSCSYFSDCVLTGREPEPSGREGLADVRIIRALYRSARDRPPRAARALSRPRRGRRSPRRSAGRRCVGPSW